MPIGIWHNTPALLETQYWGKALLIAVLTAIPYALDLMALKQLNKLTYGTLTSLAPALAALTGFLLLHEEISMLQWVFGLMLASRCTLEVLKSCMGLLYCCFYTFLYLNIY